MPIDVKRPEVKITYATMNAERLGDLHRALDEAAETVRAQFGSSHPLIIDGRAVDTGEEFEDRSPIDTRILLGRFQQASPEHVHAAVAAARAAAPGWGARPWPERLALLRKVADRIRVHRWSLAALMGYEAGKSRLECVGDVEESADLIAYYCDQIEAHHGFVEPMGRFSPNEENFSVMRPHGVWAVISPFNFPLALAAGPSGAALAAGNTVVFKPASDTPLVGSRLGDIMAEAGLPAGVFNLVTGRGHITGQALADHPGVDGVVFTGSKQVGLGLIRANAARSIPRPMVIEMGGKNPALVMRSANLEKAAEGIVRSAFGAQGQKCSACSRVYVAREVRGALIDLLVDRTRALKIGNPLQRDVWLGPVINETAVATYERAIGLARRDGGRILTGGRRLVDEPFQHGYFLEPTLVDGLPCDHPLFAEELFVPMTLVGEIGSLDEGIALANSSEYGLTAGLFSEDEREIDRFYNHVQAGVLYVNRRAGATTGAWPGINPFGGWKASGSTGRGSGGPHYVQQFMREQGRVRIR